MPQGFAFPRTFGRDPADLPQTLSRNNRALSSFLNEAVVTFDDDDWLTLPSGLTVPGNVDIDGTLNVAGAVDLGSTLDVTGAATLDSTLDVTGAADFADDLEVAGDAWFVGRVVDTYVFSTAKVSASSTLTTFSLPDRTGNARIYVEGPCGFHSSAVDAGFDITGTGVSVNFKQNVYCVAAKWANASAAATAPMDGQTITVVSSSGAGSAYYRGIVYVTVDSL